MIFFRLFKGVGKKVFGKVLYGKICDNFWKGNVV